MDGESRAARCPSVHVALAERFHSEHKGNASAILAGDYAVALACDALARVEFPPSGCAARSWRFRRCRLGAVAGQQLDMVGQGRDVELGYALKTGSYTVEGPLKLGANLGRAASRRPLETLSRLRAAGGRRFPAARRSAQSLWRPGADRQAAGQ